MKTNFLLIILIALSMFTSCSNKKDDGTIMIACNLPMTGIVGYYGEWFKNGIMLAKDDIFNRDSLGIGIDIDFQDNKGEAKEAVSIFQKQMIADPDIYMSGITSQTMAILDQMRRRNKIHFLWSFTPLYLEKGNNEFRTWVNYGIEGDYYVDFCVSRNPKKIAYAYLDIMGAKTQCRDIVVPQLKKQLPNAEILIEEYPVSIVDFKNIAIKFKEFNPDVIIVSGFKDHILNITKDFTSYNVDKSKVICSMDLLDALYEAPEEALEGLHVTTPMFYVAEKQSNYTKNWIANFVKKHNRQPRYTEAYAYDCIQIIYEAKAKSVKENISMTDALLSVDIDGATGRLKFHDNGDIVDNLSAAVFNNGKLVIKEIGNDE